jgi:hypothetical protein
MLVALPEPLRRELKEGLVRLDIDQINAVIQQVSEIDAGLARSLSNLAQDFDHPLILKALAAVAR